MAKNIKRMLAMFMVVCMIVSVLPLQALAADGDGTVTSTETSPEGLTTNVTTTTTTETGENGETKVTVTIEKDTEGTTSDGVVLDREETKTTTTEKDSDGNMTSEKTVNEGKESTTQTSDQTVPKNEVTVEVPNTVGDSNTVKFDETIIVTGDKKQGDDDAEYDQTTTINYGTVTVKNEGMDIRDNTVDENGNPLVGTELDYVMNDTAPSTTNDLIIENPSKAPDDRMPGSDVEKPEAVEGVDKYDYVYVGTGNTSQFRPAVVYKDPLDGKEVMLVPTSSPYLNTSNKVHNPEDMDRIAKDENGDYIVDDENFYLDKNGDRILRSEKIVIGPDGETYYLHRMDVLDNRNYKHHVEGWYEESHEESGKHVAGEWIVDLNAVDENGNKIQFGVVYATSQQFVLVDKNTGESIITYCADMETKTEKGFGYTIENLKDADYYSSAEADRIRAIAKAGYWGVIGNETDEDGKEKIDENGKPIPKMGSLEAMKQQLLAAGFTPRELASLTDGVAQTATQMAIWSCSNKMDDIKFVNAHYVGKPEDLSTDKSNYTAVEKYVPQDKEDEVLLMFKVYEYLKGLEPDEVDGTTADTIINSENAIKDMAVTVVKKAEDHANNRDDDENNDAYVTNLTFGLVVQPALDEFGKPTRDNLKVTIVDGNGKPILDEKNNPFVGRIAGDLQDGEILLIPDEMGNYCFENITLTEGNHTISLNLQGIQNLEEGVYLYSSQIITDEEDGTQTSSQTLVGLAGGKRAVDVSMDITFSLDVQGVVAKERIWRDEIDPVVTPPETPGNPPTPRTWTPPQNHRLANDTVEIAEEPVPLAAPVVTGDNTVLWIAFAMMIAFTMVAINIFDKKRHYETF